MESKAISALVAYGSDSSDGENEDEKDQKCTILQRLQQKAEMFKQKELDKLNEVKSPSLSKTNYQPDILDIIGEEVPPDYEIEKLKGLESSEKKASGDIFDILKSEVPPDYLEGSPSSSIEDDNKLAVQSDLKVTSKIVESDSTCHSSVEERTKTTDLDSLKENSLKPFNLISSYGKEDLEDSGNNNIWFKSYVLKKIYLILCV